MNDFYNKNDFDGQNALYNRLRNYLHDGEQVLWTGKPCRSAKPKAQCGLLFFSLFWLGFAVFWTVSAAAIGGLFCLFGIPFLGIGIWMIYNSTSGLKKRYENTVYAVTDSRALILYRTHRGENLVEYRYDRMQNISLAEVNGSVGTIRFEPLIVNNDYYGHGYGYRRHRGGLMVGNPTDCSFVLIEDVHTVYRLISEQMNVGN